MSIYLNSRGFAYALFEGPSAPRDWAVVEVRGEHRRERTLQRIDALLWKYRPDLLILQDISRLGTPRPRHIRWLNDAIAQAAARNRVPQKQISRETVRQHFAYLGKPTKAAIAAAIAKYVPALERFLPPPRKAWMSEHARMGIFDAAALALTFFETNVEVGSNAHDR
jgi:hypothetical protein